MIVAAILTSAFIIQAKSSQTILGIFGAIRFKERSNGTARKKFQKVKKNADGRDPEAVTFGSNECKR